MIVTMNIDTQRTEMIGRGNGWQVQLGRPEDESDLMNLQTFDYIGNILRARVIIGRNERDRRRIPQVQQKIEIGIKPTKEVVARTCVQGDPLISQHLFPAEKGCSSAS
jgi:hypothetical protein